MVFYERNNQSPLQQLENILSACEDWQKRGRLYQKMGEKCDLSLLKAKDVPFFVEVVDFLRSRGLKVEVRGSAVNNAINGRPREYHDIDILATGSLHTRTEAERALRHRAADTFSGGTTVQNVCGTGPYVLVEVDGRYILKNGSTTIDVSLADELARNAKRNAILMGARLYSTAPRFSDN